MSSVQPSGSSSPARNPASTGTSGTPATSATPVSTLVYESQALAPLSDEELQQLVATAQARNRAVGVTGVLVYDRGRFLQWLEGPSHAVERVWQSIRNDRRHGGIRLVASLTGSVRSFGASAMALATRKSEGAGSGSTRGQFDLPGALVDALYRSPQTVLGVFARLAGRSAAKLAPPGSGSGDTPVYRALPAEPWGVVKLVDDLVVPELLARLPHSNLSGVAIDPHTSELAQLLLATHPEAAFALIDRLRSDGRTLGRLCAGLFEPAARELGDLWRSDRCGEFEVSVGLVQLQVALRRAASDGRLAAVPGNPHRTGSVLVAPAPRETSLLGSGIASELFWRAGWDVRSEFPKTDADLGQLLKERWFDVLDLSLSTALVRDQRLPAMAASIRVAHRYSRNPGLVVIVDGRVFNERPDAYSEVGATAGSASADDLVATARRALGNVSRRKSA